MPQRGLYCSRTSQGQEAGGQLCFLEAQRNTAPSLLHNGKKTALTAGASDRKKKASPALQMVQSDGEIQPLSSGDSQSTSHLQFQENLSGERHLRMPQADRGDTPDLWYLPSWEKRPHGCGRWPQSKGDGRPLLQKSPNLIQDLTSDAQTLA